MPPPPSFPVPIGPTGAVGPQGATGTAGPISVPSGPQTSYGPTGPQGFTGAASPTDEELHHVQSLPFPGEMHCIKQGAIYGIKYQNPEKRLDSFWIAIFDGENYTFPKDPAKPWNGYQSADKCDILGKAPLPSEMLCLAAAHRAVALKTGTQPIKSSGATPFSQALDLYQTHCSDKVWLDYLEDAKNTFFVAGVHLT